MPDEEALQLCDAGDSPEIPPNAAIHDSLEVDNGEGLELEKNDEISAVDEAQPLMVVEVADQLASFDAGDREKSEYGGENVEESKRESEEEKEEVAADKDDEESKPEIELLAGEGEGVQDLESETKVENVEKSKGGSDELATVDECQVDKVGEGLSVRDVEIENEGENVEKAEAGEEEIKPITEDSLCVNEMEMVDEKATAVNDVELDENKGEDDEEEDGKVEGKNDDEMDHSLGVAKNDELLVQEGTPMVDTEMGMEPETIKSESGGKQKRGPKAKQVTPMKAPSRKIVGEDVCFICLVDGDLVLCDRRGCPKAYHRSCVDHDGEFFKTKGRWNCGWHFCHQCGKNSYFMCYTCQFSLCKSCSKDAAIFCVRGNKGFCGTCVKTIRVIENSEQNETGNDAFSDKSSWDHLFKGYWLQQKEKLRITFDELSRVKDPCKGSNKQQTRVEVHTDNYDAGGHSNYSLANKQVSDSKRKKVKRKSKSLDYATDSSSEKNANSENRKSKKRLKSQAKELNSDSEQSSSDIGSRRGTKARKLLTSRSKVANYRPADDFSEDNIEWASKELLEFVMHMKNGDQSVLTQFDVQGLLLEYIKGNKLRDPRRQSQIICDPMLQKLFGKPRVGHFEMLKLLESHFFLKDIPHADSSQGTAADSEMRQSNADNNTDSLLDGGKSRGRKSHKRGEEREAQSNLDDYAAIDMHNINLIFLRRNLLEALMENSETFPGKAAGSFVRIRISGSGQKHDIYRLVQIIGTSKSAEPYKVGKRTTDVMFEILNLGKTETIPIDTISSQEFSEDECQRLRQSIKCGLINRMTVGGVLEKAKELHEIRIVDWLEAEMERLSHLRDRASEKGHKKELRECVEKLQLLKTPEECQRRLDEIPKVHADPKMDPSCESEDELDSPKQASDVRPRETGFSRRGKDHFPSREGGSIFCDSWSANARPPNQKSDPNRSSSGTDCSGRRETLSFISPTREHTCGNGVDKRLPRSNSQEKSRVASGSSILLTGHYGMRSSMSESPSISSFAGQTGLNISETEKIWQYRDPTGKVQGPFSMTQLRKWNGTGYFPNDLRIWRISRSDNDNVLLTDLLAGRLDEEVLVVKNVPTSIDTSKLAGKSHSFGNVGIYDSPNLSSPTPARSTFQSNNQLQRGIERLPSPTPSSPTDPIGVGRSNFVSSVQPAAGQQSFSTSGYRPGLSSSSGAGNSIASKSTLQTESQPFTMLNSIMNQSTSGQGLSNVIQPGAGQNPAVYTHGWSSGHVARLETMNASMAPNNPNTASVSNQAPSYGMLAQNAGRPASTGMPRGGQQKLANHNMAWPQPSNGSTNSGWVAPPGNTGRQGGDHSRNGGAGGGQWNRQPSFGSRAQRVCKFHENGHCRKGASCDYMHT